MISNNVIAKYFMSHLDQHKVKQELRKYLVANPDFFSVIQESELLIPKSELLKNDSYDNTVNSPDIVFSGISNALNGDITDLGENIKFKSTNKTGYTAGFNYLIKAGVEQAMGKVSIDILPLPELEIFIYTSDELKDFIDSYTPPTLAEVFKSWNRFVAHNSWFPSGTTPTGEAASWEMISDNQFRCTVNSVELTGFISPHEYDVYSHTADLSSTDFDDDSIMLVIAFKRIDGFNHVLMLERETGGNTGYTNNKGFSIYYFYGDSSGKKSKVIKYASGDKCYSGGTNTSLYGWNNMSPTRVKVVRNGDSITCYSAPFKSTNLDAGEVISINLNDYPELSWAKGKCNYGYSCWSQKYSSYSNVIFEGGSNTKEAFDLDTGEVWEFSGNKWTKTGKTIQQVLGWPRIVSNPNNGMKYNILENSIVKI